MKKILSLILILSLCFILSSCGGYKTASDVVKAYYDAYNAGDSEKLLECYPENARDYFIAAEGGRESFDAAVKSISELGKTTLEIIEERDVSDRTGIDSSLEHIGNLFEYEDAKYVAIKHYLTYEDGTTYPENIAEMEETVAVCVKIDGNWYIFTDVSYED